MQMNCFIGQMAKEPTIQIAGDLASCRFTLLAKEYVTASESGEKQERQVSIPFVAFHERAEAIARHAQKGDQLIVHFRIHNSNYIKGGATIRDYSFVVEDFSFGALGEARELLTPDV